jgi:hypothetical protein
MGLQGRAVKRGGLLTAATAAAIATLASAPARAIETGGSQLPPPPPPPLTAAPPGAPTPAPAPRSAPRPATAPASGASAGASVSAGGAGASGGASVTYAGAPPPADEAPDTGPHAFDTRWFVAPMLGFASDYLNFGIGVRGGKVLDNHIYIGGTFLYSLGEGGSTNGVVVAGPNGPINTSTSWSTSGLYIGPEGGYDFDLRYVVVRPYMGLGIYTWTASAAGPAAGGSTSSTQVVAWPGCTVIWPVPHSDFFLGGDLRVLTVPGGSVGFYALGGMHFGS